MDILDTKKTSELFLVRKGWLSPSYELTDNAYVYGTMTYNGLSRRRAAIKTAHAEWLLRWMGPFTRTVTIADESGAEIGKAVRGWFTHTVSLTMNSGFKAEFRKAGFFSREFIWTADGCGTVMQIKSYPFSFKDTVTISSSMAPQAIIPLLIFLGGHLIILRRRRKAAR
jgi:hypothetical protein